MPTTLTARFTDAVDYARTAHAGQFRKGTDIPYLSHVLSVAALVLEHGGTEDQAIAGLPHDVVEDCGEEHAAVIRIRFGDDVANIVLACTDGTAESKGVHTDPESKRADWRARKQAYLAHLGAASDEVLLVSGCDKLHNARAIVRDLDDPAVGGSVFSRFTGGVDGTLWYYGALHDVLSARRAAPAAALGALVARMRGFPAP